MAQPLFLPPAPPPHPFPPPPTYTHKQVPRFGTTDKNLLLVARVFAIPMTGLACMVAALAYNPGYLLVVAFDVVLAGCFVPLMAAVYWPSMTPNAGE